MAEDRFTENFRCPNCGRVGTAKLFQKDGWAFLKGNTGTVIESLTMAEPAAMNTNGQLSEGQADRIERGDGVGFYS